MRRQLIHTSYHDTYEKRTYVRSCKNKKWIVQVITGTNIHRIRSLYGHVNRHRIEFGRTLHIPNSIRSFGEHVLVLKSDYIDAQFYHSWVTYKLVLATYRALCETNEVLARTKYYDENLPPNHISAYVDCNLQNIIVDLSGNVRLIDVDSIGPVKNEEQFREFLFEMCVWGVSKHVRGCPLNTFGYGVAVGQLADAALYVYSAVQEVYETFEDYKRSLITYFIDSITNYGYSEVCKDRTHEKLVKYRMNKIIRDWEKLPTDYRSSNP